MNLSGNTILITGGTSGIGYELARRFLSLGNIVIVTGRDQARLDETQRTLPGVHVVQSDVSDPAAIGTLYEHLTSSFPDLNVVVNNAGIMRKINMVATNDLNDLTREININLTGSIQMVQQFLPHLLTKPAAAIINISSGLAFIPLAISPIYSATKAGLHAFTQSLRIQLKHTNVAVIEVAPPGTETPLFRGDFSPEDLGGVKGMNVQVLGDRIIAGLRKDRLEIRPGLSNMLKLMSRLAPTFMTNQLGKSAEQMGRSRS